MNQTRFCRKVIWFKPLFPLGPDLERIFRHTKDHHQPPPSTGLPVVFVGRVRFFVSGRFFWGNLKNFIKSCLGSVIYGKGRDGWRCFLKDEVDKDGGGLPANHPKVRQSQGRPLYSPHFATWSIRLPRAMVPKSTKGLKRFQRLNHASCIIGLSFMTTELFLCTTLGVASKGGFFNAKWILKNPNFFSHLCCSWWSYDSCILAALWLPLFNWFWLAQSHLNSISWHKNCMLDHPTLQSISISYHINA